jgi:hypothetical protein
VIVKLYLSPFFPAKQILRWWAILVLGLLWNSSAGQFLSAQTVLLEAEQFASLGGWDLDQQAMDQMGSPYLLAHGLGVPVRDAVTRWEVPASGKYQVWVRTRDWVAPWKAPGAPGKFQVLFAGQPLPVTFGTEGAEWHWQSGGEVALESGPVEIALHDLTGFEGRCDALVLSADRGFVPPEDGEQLARWRREQLGLAGPPEAGGEFDLVVVGGGVAGTAAAVSGARNGLRVALVQDRPVLGGNSSSEVRVWPEGHTCQKPFRRIGEIVDELCPPRSVGSGNAKGAAIYDDERKLSVVAAEPRITLLLEHRVNAVETKAGRIIAVVAQHIRTARRLRLEGKVFADCTGDAAVGYLAGADYEVTAEGHLGASNLWNVLDQADPVQVLGCECKDKDALTVLTEAGQVVAPFPRLEWALDLSNRPFPGRLKQNGSWTKPDLNQLGGWFWESGFDRDPVTDIERIRDLNLRAMYGAWDTLKNVDALYPNHRLGWSAFIAGKRESRRLLGDVVLSVDDFRQGREYPDPAWPNSWHIDLHFPHPDFADGLGEDAFISEFTHGPEFSYRGPYWAPYRCLYSRNLENLFMAGRDISVEHDALGPVRVMRTCGMMGEVVGKAAWICVRHQTTPRGVYENYLELLQELMRQPGGLRRDSLDGELSLPEGAEIREWALPGIDPAVLEGIVVDDAEADLTGQWSDRGGLPGFVAEGYQYSSDPQATARFVFGIPRAGDYELRIAWQPHPNRATAAKLVIETAAGPVEVVVNQTRAPKGEQGFETLGTYRFEGGKQYAVEFRVAAAGGIVHVDAIQLVPRN